MSQSTITLNTVEMRPNLCNLLAGDRVFVWCRVSERNVWADIADVKEVNGRAKIRAAGTDFYFDEAVVVAANLCHDREDDAP